MTAGQKLVPTKINLDISDDKMPPDTARFIKGLTLQLTANSQKGVEGQNEYILKPYQATQEYYPIERPEGDNMPVGCYGSKETNEALLHFWNSNNNHFLVRINGASQTADIIYQKSYLNYQLKPQYFIPEYNGHIEIIWYADPITAQKRKRTLYFWTDGFNPQGSICLEDSLATNSFNEDQFPYFKGNYDKSHLIHWGVSTPLECMDIIEVDNDDSTKPNYLRYKTWQFRISATDVYGRPSEHGIISNLYIPGGGDCLSASDFLSRCVDLVFTVGNPLVDQIQVEFRNCNDQQWYRDTVINLYDGSPLGDWWLRSRNPDVQYNAATNEVTYRFCKNKDTIDIPPTETSRNENPLPLVSQALEKTGDVLALYNNEYGFPPFSKETKDKISVKVIQGDSTNGTTSNDLRNIDLFFSIYAPISNTQQPIWQLDNNGVFGGRGFLWNNPDIPIYRKEIISGYEQYFGDPKQRGFIVYLAGTGLTPVSAISEQYYLNDDNEMVKVETYENFDYKKRYFQRVQFFNLASGRYIVRFASHRSQVTDKEFYNTSTYVGGINKFNPSSKTVDYSDLLSNAKEKIINVCDKSYSTLEDNEILTIWDLTTAWGEETQSTDGYVYEKKENDINTLPIELLNVANPPRGQSSKITDHNGFYFMTSLKDNYKVNISGYCDCQYTQLIESETGKLNRVYHKSFTLTPPTISDNNLDGFIHCEDFGTSVCSRVTIKGKVVFGTSNVGVNNITVVYSRGQTATTDGDGNFTIIAHDMAYQNEGKRDDNLYVYSTKCNIVSQDNGCLDIINVTFNRCTDCTERIINLSRSISVYFKTKRGLLSGGNYGVAVIGHDWLGRPGAAQTRDGLFTIMPTITEMQSIQSLGLSVTIAPDIIFDSWVKKITFAITEELAYEDYISWTIDKVEFIDNAGDVNNASPTQIKLYYGSLNEYNKQNNFNTTTGWQFLYQNDKNVNVNYTSDEVEFYVNGDGKFFPTLTKAVVKYDSQGQYFLVDYDTALKDLKAFGLVRLVRPKNNANRNQFFELCVSVDINEDGTPKEFEIPLPAFDTYFINRSIPIPTTTGTGDDAVTVNLLRSFGFDFEHHSVSDLWGDHCKNIGRFFVSNPYEAIIYRPNEVALSGVISPNGRLNFLNYFDDAKKQVFKIADNSGITAAFYDNGVVLCLTGYDNFTVGFNDNLVRINADGTATASSAGSLFGNPERKIGNNYGCQLIDKNSIVKYNGLISFIDRARCDLLQSNFSDIQSYSKNVCDGWLREKIKSIIQEDNSRYFIGGIDPISPAYLLTDFDSKNKTYLNQLREENPKQSETVKFDLYTRDLREFLPATPAYWCYLDSDILNVQLFSVANGIIYSHYNITSNGQYNIVYGTSVEKIVRQVVVLDNFKKKRPLWVEVYCTQENYFSDKVLTDSNQRSRLLLSKWKKGEYFYSAPFGCDLNTNADSNLPLQTGVNKISDGDPLYGTIVDIRLVGEPSKQNMYSELTGLIVHLYGMMPSSNEAG